MCIIDTEGKILATTFAEADRYVSPAMAAWIPNILYTFIAIYLYLKAPR